MADADEQDDDGIEVARITISKVLTDDGYSINVTAADEQAEELALIDSLGMLEFAKLTIVEQNLREDDEDDTE